MTKEKTFSKNQFIAVSKALFATQGYTGTTTREIIEQVGGAAKGLLYYYFPKGKREILGCILKQNGLEKLGKLKIDFSQLTTKDELERALMANFEAVCAVFRVQENYQLFVIVIRERLLLTNQEVSLVTQPWQDLGNRLGAALNTCQASRELGEQACRSLGQVIVSIFQKAIYDTLLIRNDRQLTEQTHHQVQQQLHYLLELD
ncbi:TetR family transcriptional regulator [Secundilactobacillus pentosiphilus]|uniref:TetR family transcriptional regulator n=1 Tax=Secundilactobacillus pentosiphilus TaxID=1714682 RepID=A0A1Z5IVZ9_9LACO|nr:TetR/AcrR family transcriptional regulator [Secundilactobacillus pentosiphilus]GAX05927.1 TetR family transcriptional regulator [Secundilactobacillus pentosiphilus]